MPDRTRIAATTMRVNIALLGICVPLVILCLVRGLWIPAALFGLLILSNAVQLRSATRSSSDHAQRDDDPA